MFYSTLKFRVLVLFFSWLGVIIEQHKLRSSDEATQKTYSIFKPLISNVLMLPLIANNGRTNNSSIALFIIQELIIL